MTSTGIPRRAISNRETTSTIPYESQRRYMLKLTPIEARRLLPTENGKQRHPYCTLVLLDEEMKEIRGEKQRTPSMKDTNPCWSPLKAEMLRCEESEIESHRPLGLDAAAAAEEYTFGKVVDLKKAKYLLVKCKDKSLVEVEDLGRLLLSLHDLDTSGKERVAWYPLQLRPGGRMKKVQGEIRISSRIIQEPSRWQLWSCAKQMLGELDIRDRSFYLKLHPQCFTGRECVEWFLRHGPHRSAEGGISCSTEEEAILLGNCLIRAGIIYHVSGVREFYNSARQFYRFSVHHTDITKQNESLTEMSRVLAGESDDHPSEQFPRGKAMSLTENFNSPTGTEEHVEPTPSDIARSTSRLKISDFELLKVLGTGTYGRVLSARGPDGNIYAVKIVSKIGMDDVMRRNVKIERDVLFEVQHPFVATLSFAFQNEDKLYMGMEFFNGGDLRHHFGMNERGELPLTTERIRFYAAELVAGIAHLHSLDIVYRDLKPENILIAKDGHIKLVDFGLSKFGVKDGNRALTLAGSPDYVAPEVLAAVSKKNPEEYKGYDKACDWWSLGILIFEMYVGRTPFKDANTSIMYRNIQEGQLFLPPELPEDVKSLLRGLINRNPKERLGSNEAVPTSIMDHPYFEGLNWDSLQRKDILPPWVPDVVDATDAKYIDNEFADQVPIDTPEWRMLDSVDRQREYVEGFTFRPDEFGNH